MRTKYALVALALLMGACKTTTSTSTSVSGTPRLEPMPQPAAAAPAPEAYSPAGKWAVQITAQGRALDVTLELVKLSDGTWTGSIGTAEFGTIPLNKATLDGKKMVMSFPVPTGDMGSMTLMFDGDSAEGEWSMPGDGSKASGKRNR